MLTCPFCKNKFNASCCNIIISKDFILFYQFNYFFNYLYNVETNEGYIWKDKTFIKYSVLTDFFNTVPNKIIDQLFINNCYTFTTKINNLQSFI